MTDSPRPERARRVARPSPRRAATPPQVSPSNPFSGERLLDVVGVWRLLLPEKPPLPRQRRLEGAGVRHARPGLHAGGELAETGRDRVLRLPLGRLRPGRQEEAEDV